MSRYTLRIEVEGLPDGRTKVEVSSDAPPDEFIRTAALRLLNDPGAKPTGEENAALVAWALTKKTQAFAVYVRDEAAAMVARLIPGGRG